MHSITPSVNLITKNEEFPIISGKIHEKIDSFRHHSKNLLSISIS